LTKWPEIHLGLPGFLHREPRPDPTEQFRGPQPLPTPRGSLLFQPIHLILLLLVVVIVAAAGFFAMQAQRALQDPTLTVSSPATGLYTVPITTTEFTLVGKATPKAQISVKADGRDPMRTQADAAGNWTFKVTLHSGLNQFDIFSTDLRTNHNSPSITRVINVPSPTSSPIPMFVAIDSPTDGQAFKDGRITVSGTTVSIISVTVTPTYLGVAPATVPTPKPASKTTTATAQPTLMPLPTATETPQGSPTPTPKPTPIPTGALAPVQVIPTIDGKFQVPLQLYSGRWKLTAVGTNKDGVNSDPVSVNVIVTSGSLVVTFTPNGSGVKFKIWRDGRLYRDVQVYPSAVRVKIVADQSVWIWTSNAYKTLVFINGGAQSKIGLSHGPGAWRITAYGPPVPSTDH
jgi:hypothetical protein